MTTTAEATRSPPDPLAVELYKSLRGEAVSYLEKIPGLWLQKFLLTGAVIAFLASTSTKVVNRGPLLAAAIAAIPVLAVLLDIKVAEYTLHARALSLFIRQNFAESPSTVAWESALWADDGPAGVTSLMRLRSATTVIVTAVPTAVLVALAGVAIDEIGGTRPIAAIIGGVLAALYCVAVVVISRRVWPRL